MAAHADQAQLPAKRSRHESSQPLASSWTAANSALNSSSNIGEKLIVSRWSRDDLEDKFISLYEVHNKLKERFRDQEDKIQEFKLLLKKRQDQIRQQQAKVGAGAAELRATDQVVKLEMRNLELEKQAAQLQQRLTLLQSQLDSPSSKRQSANTRVLQPPPGLRPQHNLGRQDDVRLKLQAENRQLLAEIEGLKDKLYAQEMEHQRRVQDLHSELDTARLQVGSDKRLTMQDDLEKVKLQRELREKSAMVEHLQARCDAHEERERQALDTSSRLQTELERFAREGRRRDQEAESLKESSAAGQTLRRRVMELEHALEDASKEAKLLKESNDKLMNSAFDVERERQWQAREAALQAQLKQLEAVAHRDVGEKGEVLDRLEMERNRGEGVERELSALRIKCFELQEQNDSLRQKVAFFTQESAGDVNEMEEALLVVKQRRQGSEPAAKPDFLHQTGSAEDSPQRHLREMEAAHADTIQELEKTRQLLEAQYRINLDLKESHGLTERQLEEISTDRETKLSECAKLLDIRAARIRKLERQLRDVAYGTRQFSLATASLDEAEEAETAQVHLQNGENLVEIHIGRLLITEEGSQLLGPEPALFCTWAFYACEMQTTDVMHSNDLDFDKTVQYVVKVDDAFLHYVNKEKMKLELFQAHGMEYKSLAACRISVRELLDSQPSVPVLGRATLLSETGDPVGVLEYRLRMRVPMQQAMRLYRERAKALGYMSANQQAAADGLKALDVSAEQRREAGGAHSLDVKVVRCRDLKSRRTDVQPSPYCSYKFFSCEDSLSPAIPNSCEPEFHFHQRLELPPGSALDKYLRTQQLAVWVIDEAEPDASAYLGVAKVDLVSLSQNKTLHGTYQLLDPEGRPSGTVDMEIFWRLPYAPAGGWDGQSEPLPLLAGEADKLNGVQGADPVSAESRHYQQTTKQLREKRQPQRVASKSGSRAESAVAEEACVEKFKGVDEQFYRQHRQQHRASSSRVMKELSTVLTAPADRALQNEREDSTDAESVSSVVPKPVNVDRSSLSQSNVDQQLESMESGTFENNVSKAVPDSPRLQEKLRNEEQREQDAQRKAEQEYDEGELPSEHESDDVVVETGTGERAVDSSCTVQVFQLQLDEGSKQFHNPDLDATRCYVSFNLPGYAIEDTETPLSLPTPRPGKSRPKEFDLTFNFQKRFDYSYEKEYNRRLQLATMLLQGQVELRFSVVCESIDEENEFFLDLAQATVPLAALTAKGQELNETSFPLLSENSAIGSIKISTDLPCLLHEVLQELPEGKRSEVQAKLRKLSAT